MKNKKHITISLCMITLNEEKFIGKCLKHIKPYVDEIIIVDGGFKDKTVEIAKKYGAKIIYHKWNNNFAKQRNISLRYATKEWIFVADPDEVQEKKLLQSLQSFTSNNIGIDMFAFPRKNYIDDKQTSAYPDIQLRFFPNNKTIKYTKVLHERPVGWKRMAIISKMHIIHAKSSERQAEQNKLYNTIEKLYKLNGKSK